MRFEALDSWRGIFALSVAMVHLGVMGHFFHWPFIRNGGYAVDFFFVLSGFVISHAYGVQALNEVAIKGFLLKRIARIYPLHLFTLALFFGLELAKWVLMSFLNVSSGEPPFTGTNTLPALVDNLLLLNGMGVTNNYAWNGPSWSISSEMWVYVVFALLSAVFPTIRGRVAIIVCAVALWCYIRILSLGGTNLDAGFVRCLLGFFCGVGMYELYRQRVADGGTWGGWTEIVAAAAFLVFMCCPSSLWPYELIPKLLAPFVAGFMVLSFAFQRGPL